MADDCRCKALLARWQKDLDSPECTLSDKERESERKVVALSAHTHACLSQALYVALEGVPA